MCSPAAPRASPGTVHKAQDGSYEIVEPYDPERYKRERAEGAKGAAPAASSPGGAGRGRGGGEGVTDDDYDSFLVRNRL